MGKKFRKKSMLWFIVAIIAIITTSCGTTHKVYTEILIDAEPADVWKVIIDRDGYKDWNPIIIPISGVFAEGETMEYEWKQNNGEVSKLKSKVIKLVENKELHQHGGTFGILTYDHRYILKPENGKTHVTQSEEYNGIGLWFWDAETMKAEYQKVNKKLKERVETINKQ